MKTCNDCIHEYACKCWTAGRVLAAGNAARCPAFETAKDSAAYLIGKLDAEKTAVPRWISVEERLPERHGQACVGLYSQHGAGKSVLFPYVFTWHAYGDNGYVNGPHFSDEGLDGLKVYYWMPLPEPPKNKAKAGE